MRVAELLLIQEVLQSPVRTFERNHTGGFRIRKQAKSCAQINQFQDVACHYDAVSYGKTEGAQV